MFGSSKVHEVTTIAVIRFSLGTKMAQLSEESTADLVWCGGKRGTAGVSLAFDAQPRGMWREKRYKPPYKTTTAPYKIPSVSSLSQFFSTPL